MKQEPGASGSEFWNQALLLQEAGKESRCFTHSLMRVMLSGLPSSTLTTAIAFFFFSPPPLVVSVGYFARARVCVAVKIHLASGADRSQVAEDPVAVVMRVTTNCQAPHTARWLPRTRRKCRCRSFLVCVCVIELWGGVYCCTWISECPKNSGVNQKKVITAVFLCSLHACVCVCSDLPIYCRSPPVLWHTEAVGVPVVECQRAVYLPWRMGVGSSGRRAFHPTSPLTGAHKQTRRSTQSPSLLVHTVSSLSAAARSSTLLTEGAVVCLVFCKLRPLNTDAAPSSTTKKYSTRVEVALRALCAHTAYRNWDYTATLAKKTVPSKYTRLFCVGTSQFKGPLCKI